jgi:hypothetical protein
VRLLPDWCFQDEEEGEGESGGPVDAEEEQELAESEASGSNDVIAESDAASGAAEPLGDEEEVHLPFLECPLCFVSASQTT